MMESIFQDPIFRKAAAVMEIASLSPEELKEYEKSLQEYWESTGYFNGAAQERNKIARNLKKMGLQPADISKATDLSVAEIEKL